MKNAIAINANNLLYFKVMVKNFPKEIEDDILCIFTDTRLNDITKELKEVLDSSSLNLKYRIFTKDVVYNKLNEVMEITDFAESYTMSLNILMYWFCFKFNNKIDGLLIIDDDVIISRGINDLFDGGKKNSSLINYVELHCKLQLQMELIKI